MGFPVVYTDLFLPKLLLYFLTLLGYIRTFVCALLSLVGINDFLEEQQLAALDQPAMSMSMSVSAALIRELLPVMRFADLAEQPENCAVCLYEFGGEDEIRRLINCRHVFHRSCVDHWMDHDHKTCPLCRTQFVPEDMLDAFNERLWAASGMSHYYAADSSPAAAAL